MPSSPTNSSRKGCMETIMLGDVRRVSATEKVVWSDPVSISDGSKQNNIDIIIHSNDPQSLGRHGGDYLCLFRQRRYQQRLPCLFSVRVLRISFTRRKLVGHWTRGHNFLST